ncbi:hypothetical protein [Telmatospirillum siberiense]|uniref:hypothetical protein n=1 Tax=Telmatospirillum siberiense TaxID=382514 RepID=UPI001304455E|nr:hypothetical protein [Telmatospirillum siberiense]
MNIDILHDRTTLEVRWGLKAEFRSVFGVTAVFVTVKVAGGLLAALSREGLRP